MQQFLKLTNLMRKLLISTICILASHLIQAQEVLISAQNFETNPPADEMTYKIAGIGGTASSYSGMSPSDYFLGDSPFYADGAKGFGINNSVRYIDFDAVNTNSYSNIRLSFKLAAFATTTAQGLDQTDKVTVFVSTDGVTYYEQIIITGNNNAYWSYNAAGTASTAYSTSAPETFRPSSTEGLHDSDGLGTVQITGLPATAQLFVRIEIISNRAEEIWIVDKVQLIGQMVSLPVEMTQFNVQNEGKKQRLNWVTALENDVESFIIESGKNESSFQPIGKVMAIGAGGYTFVDEKPWSGTTYYRLKIVDNDGRFTYSKIESGFTSTHKWHIYPTLASDYITLETEDRQNFDKTEHSHVSVFDLTGRIVFIQSLEKGESSIKIPLRNFNMGVYLVKLGDMTQRFVKQ